MPWVRISDDYSDHAKLRDLTAAEVAMWLAGIAYANRNLSDGVIPARVTAGFITTDGLYERDGRSYREVSASAVVRRLVVHGLWHDLDSICASCPPVASTGEYRIHDYLDYQPSREKVLMEREKTRLRVGRHRAGKRDSNEDRTPVTSGVTNAPVTHAPKSQSQELPRHTESSPDSYGVAVGTDTVPTTRFLERYASIAGINDVPAIVEQIERHTGLRVSGDRAIGIARWILDKSAGDIAAPQRYVMSAIARTPAEIEQHILVGAA